MLARLLTAYIGRFVFLWVILSPLASMATMAEPTIQASSLAVSDLGSGTLTLTWTRGNGVNVLIVARLTANSAVPPVDNTSYTANNVFGSGSEIGGSGGNFVVFSGTGTSVNIRGLAAGTGYTFEAYEFDTGNSPDPDYLTASPGAVATTTSSALILYSYQSGNAETPATWTTDSSGETLVNSAVPGSADEAVILLNRTVTVTENDFDVNHMRVQANGTLALVATSGHNYSQMSGTGLITSTSTHPAVTTNDFAATSGGTFEYVTSAGSVTLTASNETTYNNLIIDNTTLTAGLDMTVNGTLTLENSSTLTLGNGATVRDFTFNNITVNNGNSITTNTTSATHTATITGNVTNSGTIDFTTQASAEYTADPTVGVVEVTFSGTDSQTLSCSGNTDFFRLIVNKGSGQTSTLTVSSTSTDNFRIFGRNDQTNTSSGDDANPTINKALSIQNGTLELGANISIPSLTEGGTDYFIPQNGALHINGASVTVTVTGGMGSNQSLNLVGKLQVSSGSYNNSDSDGITYAGNAELDIDGGTVNISQLRASSTTIGTANALAYDQSAGTVTIDQSTGGNSASEARLDMEAANTTETRNSFTMSGGTLTVSSPNAVAGISIITKDSDFSITGGTVIAEVTDATNFGIVVNGAFNNLTVQEDGDGATGDVRTADDGPITTTSLDVNGNLTLSSNVTLTMNSDDLLVGGNLVVGGGSTLTPGTNTLTFDGTGDQAFTMTGTITSLNNVTMNKSGGTLTPSAAMAVGAALTLTAGTFADGGFTHTVAGAVTNSATHSGSGAISLTGTATQAIGGDGTGVFQNLTLFNTNAASAPISTSADITVNGVLTFSNDKLFNIGSDLLTFGSSATTSGESSARYIQTSGTNADDGVTRTYGATGSFTWPIGVGSYTPATINVATASSTGTINVKPVDAEHPNVTQASTSLTYYWRVSSSGFTGESNITHTYTYADGDIVGTETDYTFGRFNTSNSTWTSGDAADVVEASNAIGGTGNLSGAAFIDGDFTAGDPTPDDPFASVTIFYSRNDATNITTTGADWDTDSGGSKTTWSTTAHSGSAATQLPQDVTGAQVIIASGHIVNLTTNTRSSASMELTGTLDLGGSTGHDFGTISGTGNLVISSSFAAPVFPSGDASEFLGASGGTVTYDNGDLFFQTLPSSPTTYHNLTIVAGVHAFGASNVTLPNASLTILNDLTITDGASASNSASVFAPNGVTYAIGNDLILTSLNSNSVTLQLNDGSASSFTVSNDVTIGSSTTFNLANTNFTHTLSIGASLTNNGTLDLVPNAGTGAVDVTFTGSSAASITGTGATTDFGPLTINKGSDISSELNVNATAFSLTGLTLTNGTFRLTSAQSITPSATTYTIPSNTRLATSGGTINFATTGADGNDLFLNGELEVVSGSVIVGNTSNSNNNDIEYASTGSPTIDVQGGTLTVNGQIRRPTSTTSGNLTYSQTGGTVNIHGSNSQNTRAKLEVANSGSFTMTSGTINIIRGSGTTFNDLYLHPGSNTISGGTIDFTPGSNGNQTFTISSGITLNDIAVTGNGGSNTASLTIQNQALSLNGLTIAEANSTFDANGFGVNIGGGFSNTGTFTANSNTTTFNGSGAQAGTINASTTFHDLVLNKSAGTLTISGTNDITVANDLTLTSGTVEDGGRTINVTGNVTNNATHTSGTVGTGGISLSDANHNISGTGTFGNLTLTGTSRTTTVGGAITLNADLDFTGTVVLDIESNALNFGSDATITGSSFGSTKMIRTSANNGITKSFPASTLDFTFPIGIGTDYTPVRTNLTTNTNTGTITVETFDERHPLTNDAADTELTRYWTLATTGLAGAVATLEFTYVDADVQGTEASYVTGTVVSGDWSPAGGTGSTVTAGSNLISLTGTSTIAAQFTAGLTAEFSAVDTYFSRATGDWETAGTWSTISHVGAAASTAPNGHNVEISSDHTVTVTSDNASAFSLVLGGTLTLGTTIGHDFGTVTGAGTKSITATTNNNFNFPQSDISGFTGTHEFTGSTDGNMLNTPSAFHNLTFSGTSTKNLENTSFTISNDFSMSAGTVNQTSAATVSLGGSFSNTGATFNDTAGVLDLNGTGTQSITASGGTTTFNNLTLSNTSGTVTVNDNIDMNGTFTQVASTTLDMDANCVGGTGTVIINGRVQTSNANGLSGGATTTFENTLGGVTLNSGSTVAYDLAGAQTVSARTDYDGLEVGGSGAKSLDGSATIAGSLNVSAGELSLGANTLSLDGTVTGVGTITGSTTSNISVGGTGDAGTIDFTTGGETLGDLTINRTSSGTVAFEDDFTVNSAVTLTNGIVTMANNTTMTVGASGAQGTITGGTDDIYFNTDPIDDDEDDNPSIDVFHEGTDITIPMGYNPFFSINVSCPTCSGHKFKARIRRGPYNTPPSSDSRVTTNVVAAQWSLRKIQGAAADVTVTLCWSSSAETSGLGSNVGISIWNSNLGSPFWDVGNNISAKSGSGPFCQTRTFSIGAGEDQRFFLAVTNDQSPLPVNLLSFSGEMNNRGAVDLLWETADEVNNDFFEVQRSANGLSGWEGLGTVNGNGTSSGITSYSFTDESPNKDRGQVYYRLKQVDFNGLTDYSPVIAVSVDESLFEEDKDIWKVYPNPSHGYDLEMVLTSPQFSAQDEFQFRLLNSAGQVMYNTQTTGASGTASIKDLLTFAASGIYILEIATDGKVERHRLIKQ